ncbi:hypothetical protein PIB30_056464 [Stylosanthes scabra]|uniref:Uncharacterized protein n=1 Tax=Stylosanthes scabra TaxID=79078 RepID=A0ABU6YI65_9FABA|nr:hypothetical protein [Stylosanthes scabra]
MLLESAGNHEDLHEKSTMNTQTGLGGASTTPTSTGDNYGKVFEFGKIFVSKAAITKKDDLVEGIMHAFNIADPMQVSQNEWIEVKRKEVHPAGPELIFEATDSTRLGLCPNFPCKAFDPDQKGVEKGIEATRTQTPFVKNGHKRQRPASLQNSPTPDVVVVARSAHKLSSVKLGEKALIRCEVKVVAPTSTKGDVTLV